MWQFFTHVQNDVSEEPCFPINDGNEGISRFPTKNARNLVLTVIGWGGKNQFICKFWKSF